MKLYTTYNDEQLVQLLQSGDEFAFTEIYNRYWYNVLAGLTKAIRSQTDAEDLVQELFGSLWKRRRELNITGTLSAYLFTSARYMGIRYIKNNISQSNYLAALSATFSNCQFSDAETNLSVRELERTIETAINTLPAKMKEVFCLSRRQHLSYKEIAQQLGISEETVKKQVYNALKLLRSQLGGDVPLAVLVCLTGWVIY